MYLCFGGLHSTEVVLLLPTQQPLGSILGALENFSLDVASGTAKNRLDNVSRNHLVLARSTKK